MSRIRPLAIDLFCGLGGWAEGFLSEGWDVIGFDIERHRYPIYERTNEADPSGVKAPGNDTFKKNGQPCNKLTDRRYGSGVVTQALGETLGWHEYPCQLVLQDVATLQGSQFRNADVIVASPPCQEYSYRAMPWKQSKALTPEEVGLPEPSWWRLPEYKPLDARKDGDAPCMTLQDMAEWAIWRRKHLKAPPDNTLFETCFRLQREASEAAGRYIPLIVENVRGAEKWVGLASWHFGSYYLWGDIPALMPPVVRAQKFNPDGTAHPSGSWFAIADSVNRGSQGQKINGYSDPRRNGGKGVHRTSQRENEGGKGFARRFEDTPMARVSSKSNSRKAASAQIAKIPFPLAQHIARVFRPTFHVEHPVSGP